MYTFLSSKKKEPSDIPEQFLAFFMLGHYVVARFGVARFMPICPLTSIFLVHRRTNRRWGAFPLRYILLPPICSCKRRKTRF